MKSGEYMRRRCEVKRPSRGMRALAEVYRESALNFRENETAGQDR